MALGLPVQAGDPLRRKILQHDTRWVSSEHSSPKSLKKNRLARPEDELRPKSTESVRSSDLQIKATSFSESLTLSGKSTRSVKTSSTSWDDELDDRGRSGCAEGALPNVPLLGATGSTLFSVVLDVGSCDPICGIE